MSLGFAVKFVVINQLAPKINSGFVGFCAVFLYTRLDFFCADVIPNA